MTRKRPFYSTKAPDEERPRWADEEDEDDDLEIGDSVRVPNAPEEVLGNEDDLMPDCMAQDAIGPDKLVWDVSAEVVEKLYERPAQFRESLFALRPG